MTDTCPQCLHRAVPPTDTRHEARQTVHAYRCPRCRHAWTTSRHHAATREETRP